MAVLRWRVFGHNMKSSNDFIGRIVIGQYSSGPSESNHWRRMLNTHRTAVEQWHSLRSRAECDRVSPASLENIHTQKDIAVIGMFLPTKIHIEF
ncbi:synaptotagmin-17-like protein [Cricetulus griseus]|uniref:Synaptotagmin-17-like protein n=1 Tax=Cricetulus griseus TaxID=10029 RepID=A0A061I9T3_CRIGR|nr:synaptotagmin-17-like protein [Cricetulus griseus]